MSHPTHSSNEAMTPAFSTGFEPHCCLCGGRGCWSICQVAPATVLLLNQILLWANSHFCRIVTNWRSTVGEGDRSEPLSSISLFALPEASALLSLWRARVCWCEWRHIPPIWDYVVSHNHQQVDPIGSRLCSPVPVVCRKAEAPPPGSFS